MRAFARYEMLLLRDAVTLDILNNILRLRYDILSFFHEESNIISTDLTNE